MKIVSIVGGRANLIKVEPLHVCFDKNKVNHLIVDVGVYNKRYGQIMFKELGLPVPVEILDPNETHLIYLEKIKWLAERYESILKTLSPDLILVYGDLDPGVAAVTAATKLAIPVAHVEAGLRSNRFFDTEELNRMIIDKFSQFLFANSISSRENLLREKTDASRIYIAGNTIIDALKRHKQFSQEDIINNLKLSKKGYALVTLHRDENTKDVFRLKETLLCLKELQKYIPLVFVQYSSTADALKQNGFLYLLDKSRYFLLDSVSYHEYIGLLENALLVFTDSSGIQDESSYLNIPCMTCRNATHRIDTLNYGTNILVDTNINLVITTMNKLLNSTNTTVRKYPDEWDLNVGSEIYKTIKDVAD